MSVLVNPFRFGGGGGGGGPPPGGDELTFASAVDLTNGGANDLTEVEILTGLSNPDRIEIALEGASLSGTDQLLVQLGTSGGWATTGYDAWGRHQIYNSATADGAASAAGFVVSVNAAAGLTHLRMVLTLVDPANNVWQADHTGIWNAGSNLIAWGGGRVALSGTATRVRVKSSGTNTFDGGNGRGAHQ